MRKLWWEIAHTGGATVVSVGASVISLIVTARLLGPEGRGVLAAATSWVGLFASLGSLSLGQVLVHHVAGRPSEEWLPQVFGSVVTICLVVTSGAWLLVFVLHRATDGRLFNHLSPGLLAVAFVPLPFLMWTEVGRYLLAALDKVRVANWAQMAGAVMAVLAVLLLVAVLGLGVGGALWAGAVASVCAGTLTFAYVTRRASSMRLRRTVLKVLLSGSARLHFNAVGNYLFTQASVLVLNFYRSPAETGYYQLATQLFSFGLVISASVSSVSFGLVARKGPDGAWPEQRRLLIQALLAATVVIAVGYAAAPLAIRVVAGAQFLPAAGLLRVALPALLGATCSTVMASQWIGRGLFIEAAGLTFAVGVLSLALDVALVPRYGMYGALVSTLSTYAVSLVVNLGMALWVNRRWRDSLVVA